MTAVTYYNRVKFTTATTGTGTLTVGSAVANFRTPAGASVPDGALVSYVIEDGSNWETGRGTYTVSGTTLSRGATQSTNSDNEIDLSGSATVRFTALAVDFETKNILELVWDYMAANNTDPIDAKITSGDYVGLIYFKGANSASFVSATNATHTVTAGKTLVLLQWMTSSIFIQDYANRQWRIYNSTDTAVVLDYNDLRFSNVHWVGDGGTASKLTNIAATKTVVLQVWSTDTTKRAVGGWAIFKEV